jgi:hypothetical protein
VRVEGDSEWLAHKGGIEMMEVGHHPVPRPSVRQWIGNDVMGSRLPRAYRVPERAIRPLVIMRAAGLELVVEHGTKE